MGADRRDYLPASIFEIEIDGIVVGHFKKVSGLTQEVDQISVRNGNSLIEGVRPGRPKPVRIVLERGEFRTPELRNWFDLVVKGTASRKSVSIVVKDRTGAEKMRYNLFESWPYKWEGPELDAGQDGTHQVERISFVAETMQTVG